jgi:hypothetical protein
LNLGECVLSSKWRSLDLNLPDFKTGSLEALVSHLRNMLQALVSLLEKVLLIAGALDDPLVMLLKKLIEELRSLIDNLLDDSGAYVLHVPVRKRIMTHALGIGDITPPVLDTLSIFAEPYSTTDIKDPALLKFESLLNRHSGGNAGFFELVWKSLNDHGDLNKPTFEEDSYIGGAVLLMGTEADPMGFLDDLFKFAGIFGNNTTPMPKIPRPKNLKVLVTKTITDHQFDAFLSWDVTQMPLTTLVDLGGVVLSPERVAIIRGRNNVECLSATNVVDLLETRDLRPGLKNKTGDVEVRYEGRYIFTDTVYIDEDIECDVDDIFYYAVAWKLRARRGEGSTEEGRLLEYWYISNVVQVSPYTTTPESTPPNWHRTPSIADLFPAFAAVLRKAVNAIEKLASRITTTEEMMQQYIDFLRSEIARYDRMITKILSEITKLKTGFELPDQGIYLRTFHGVGGVNFLITDLASSLLDSYPGAPPFHKGTEFVTGSIILTGGPKRVVQGTMKALDLILIGKEPK